MGYYGSCGYYSSISNSYTSKNSCISTNPTAISYGNWQGICAPTVFSRIRIPILGETLIQVNRMRSCIYLYSWSYKHVIAYGYLIAVYQHTTVIDAYIVADKYIVTKSNNNTISYAYIISNTAKQLFNLLAELI